MELNQTQNINFQKLYIKNKNSWHAERLREFAKNDKIKSFAAKLDQKGADVIAESYNYFDSGNRPENYGVILKLRLKKGVESKSGLREIVTKVYHCAMKTLLDGFNTEKALKKANNDISYMINGTNIHKNK